MKKSKGKDTKTNAMRILDKNKIAYKEHLYECDGFMDGVSIAQKLGQPTERVFKTLVAEGKSKQYYVLYATRCGGAESQSRRCGGRRKVG